MQLHVVWVASVREGRLSTWRIAEDTATVRAEFGIPAGV